MISPHEPDSPSGQASITEPGQEQGSVRERVGEAGEHLRQVGHIAKESAREGLHRVRDAAREKYEEGVDAVRQFGETLEDRIRHAPIKSVLIAAGAGFLLSMMMGRR